MIVRQDSDGRANERSAEELAMPVVVALKTDFPTLWDRLKRHEADPASTDDDILGETLSLIHGMNDELKALDLTRALIKVREMAIAETEQRTTRR